MGGLRLRWRPEKNRAESSIGRRAKTPVLMPVLVMDVGVVGVRVPNPLVAVGMGVRLLPVPFRSVRMPVMRIVPMRVTVLERLMRVRMSVLLAQVQPYARGHQGRGDPEQGGRCLTEERQRDEHAEERRHSHYLDVWFSIRTFYFCLQEVSHWTNHVDVKRAFCDFEISLRIGTER